MAEPASQRPKYNPTPCISPLDHTPLHETNGKTWVPLICCSAGFPQDLFETALEQLVHHPEYNSTLILRSDCLSETTEDFPDSIPALDGFTPSRCIHRKLLPRRPGRDAALEQYCTFYCAPSDHIPSVLVLTPIIPDSGSLPYYHPAVSHLAFRYITSAIGRGAATSVSDSGATPASGTATTSVDEPAATLRLEVDPLPSQPTTDITSPDVNSRLYRTGLALLETAHRYGWGALTQYKKRVHHDCLVPREPYQDLYLVMRARHRHLVDEWQESTDPLKHVFEDIGIATYLMLLWRYTFGDETRAEDEQAEALDSEPCGNGLLTHILVSEGYAGHGFDVRARVSWSHYPPATQQNLHVHALDPTSAADDALIPRGAFLIGNHADELTPWVPILATRQRSSGYISVPCCAWAFDTKYQRSRWAPYPTPEGFVEGLNLGGGGAVASSGYSMYRVWLASLSLHCGWDVETEALRIPSTRNWAIVGRKRVVGKDEEGSSNVEGILDEVRERGAFNARVPEGKAGEH
ncbi:hypothetical protein BD626DRAFT_575689 [Schizophyllum amplum]|uniref:tRNA (uracil-O(2)-)-methyltransferase n=1 Tax=Schizophyllum amplum TaxID=97359 RepID=A0A550BVB3_9AGAR|nr:hypothetical protein BD626DRAFT_575689 [Auriculariopsis ampla]